jgi:alpha-ketoglutarate-dependent taurine dioxygenase
VLVSPDQRTATLGALDPDEIATLYKRHGAILLRGFALDVDSFSEMVARFCTHAVANNSTNRDTLDPKRHIQTVDKGAQPFPLHTEMSRLPWRPDIAWFGCLQPPSNGGETTVCDGIEIVAAMPEETRRAFENRRLLYVAEAQESILEFWFGTARPDNSRLEDPPADCPFRFVSQDGAVYRMFTTPALQKPMFDERLAWGNFLFFSRYAKGRRNFPVFGNGEIVADELVAAVKQVADRLEQPVQWREGDLLMLDNTRFLHGRRAIDTTDDRLIMSYFGYLDFAEPDPEEPPNAKWRDPEAWTLNLESTN